MRIAVFSDVHGNLTALKAVLNHIAGQEDLDRIVFAGDACLFGPRPLECLEEIRDREISCLVGNTDVWIHRPPEIERGMNQATRDRMKSIQEFSAWTIEKLDDGARAWLTTLESSFQLRISPNQNTDDDLLVVHANPQDLNRVIFPDEEKQKALLGAVRQKDEELEPLFIGTRAAIVAFGHLHVPGLRFYRNMTLANISSVSFPGDGDWRAKYAVLSWEELPGWSVVYHRVEYLVEDEIQAFRRQRPPGWEDRVSRLRDSGLIAQEL
jgi:predicted phosphodiesterase